MKATRYTNPSAIVEAEWLANHLNDPGLRVFDCTTFLHEETGTGRPYSVESGRAEYEKAHIPGSAFLDLQEELSDSSSKFRFTLPDVETLAARFAENGISAGSRVILYSRKRMQWATRLRLNYNFDFGDDWMFEITCDPKTTHLPRARKRAKLIHERGSRPIQYPHENDEG
jgi:3-mercaptopyruvate sulfurtransferase SseA